MRLDDLNNMADRAMDNKPCGNNFLDQLNRYPIWLGSDPYYRFLRLVSAALQPRVTLELGVYMGLASGYMAAGHSGAACIGVDIDFHPMSDRVFRQFYPRLIWINNDTIDAYPEVDACAANVHGSTGIGILYIDALHETERVLLELKTYRPLLANPCVICFDDIRAPTMEGLWDRLDMEKVRLDQLHTYNNAGFGAAIYRGQDEIIHNNTP